MKGVGSRLVGHRVIGQFQSGQSLTAIASVFAASSEFATRYGNLSNREFVNQIYMNVLGRPADSAGSDFWTAQLAAGQSRGAMLSQFSESVEYRAASSNAIYVTAMYIAFLRRAPDAAGYAFWKPQLDGGRSGRDLITQFVGSSEYRTRFLP